MDDMLENFRRQYLQQVQPTNIRYPPVKLLVTEDVQHQIYRYFFDGTNQEYLPPPSYQRRVLKKIISDIERELSRGGYDEDEYAVSDELMSHMGTLSAMPQQSESEAAQELRTLSYFTPSLRDSPGSQDRILIRESPNLLAAGSNVGLRTWEACLRLAYYLCTASTLAQSHPNHKGVAGSNVIELGAGTGLLSLICAHELGADNVIATDGLVHVVEGIQTNIDLNKIRNEKVGRASIKSAVLDWTNPEVLSKVLKDHGDNLAVDYVLGADITYHPELFSPLAGILRTLKTKFPKARILIAATVRNEATLRKFHQICTDECKLHIREVQGSEWKCPPYVDQTGLFHEQAFPITIMDISLAEESD